MGARSIDLGGALVPPPAFGGHTALVRGGQSSGDEGAGDGLV
jgi:hypothetical protein